MRRYIVWRLQQFLPVLFAVSVAVFVMMRVLPGDVAIVIMAGPGGSTAIDEQQLRQLRQELGLNDPIHVQYINWIGGLLRGDIGKSPVSKEPVLDVIGRRLGVTAQLAMLTLTCSLLLSLPIGILSAIRQDTWVDYLFRVISVAGLAMPTFVTGTVLVLALVLLFRWLPPVAFVNVWENPSDSLTQLAFPALVLGYSLSAVVSRMTRSTTLEVLRLDYMRTARSKGLHERVVITRHALKNALLPVVTLLGLQMGMLLSNTVVVETIFAVPGLGRGLVGDLVSRDFPLVQTAVLTISVWFMVVNLAVDALYGWLDPRIRYQ